MLWYNHDEVDESLDEAGSWVFYNIIVLAMGGPEAYNRFMVYLKKSMEAYDLKL